MKNKFTGIILAGGKGTRMNGYIPKVLVQLFGRPLIFWTLDTLGELDIKEVVVVTGYKSGDVEDRIKENGYIVKFSRQEEALGTADAVKTGLHEVNDESTDVLVLYGDDSSLYKTESLNKMIESHSNSESPITLLSLKVPKQSHLGGLERDDKGNVVDVLSHSELVERGAKETEILCGCFCFDRDWLVENIKKIKKGKIKGEYPLPVLIKMAADQNKHANVYHLESELEWNSVNTREELEETIHKIQHKVAVS